MTRGRRTVSTAADDAEVMTEFGRRLRQARLHADLSQSEVAALLGLRRTSVTNIEAGRQAVSLPTFLSFADAVGVEPWELLGHHCNGGNDA